MKLKKYLAIVLVIVVLCTFCLPPAFIQTVKAEESNIEVGELVDESFSNPMPYGTQGPKYLSGWEVNRAGGDFDYSTFTMVQII